MQHHKLFFYSLSSLLLGVSGIAYAEELVNVPELEGGITASIGTFYVQPSAENLNYAVDITPSGNQSGTLSAADFNSDYSFGTQATLGYLFDETANGIELAYRNLNSNDSDSGIHDFSTNNGSPEFVPGHSDVNVGYELNAFDLLLSQYVNIGEHMQLRFNGGLAYVELEQNAHLHVTYDDLPDNSDGLTVYGEQNNAFTGWGPRMGIDTRYAFGQGIGIVGNGSIAYYLGELTVHDHSFKFDQTGQTTFSSNEHHIDAHAIVNLRANLGLDYVYAFEAAAQSTLGLELGYQVDYYDDAVAIVPGKTYILPYDVTFSGPYLNLKGVF